MMNLMGAADGFGGRLSAGRASRKIEELFNALDALLESAGLLAEAIGKIPIALVRCRAPCRWHTDRLY